MYVGNAGGGASASSTMMMTNDERNAPQFWAKGTGFGSGLLFFIYF